MRIHEYLEIDENKKIRCLKCGHIFCNADENYKEYALKAEVPGPELGEHFFQDPAFTVYHEYYCPGCVTMLEAEALPPGHPTLWDIRIKEFAKKEREQ